MNAIMFNVRFIFALPAILRLAWRVTKWHLSGLSEDELDALMETPLFRRDYQEIRMKIFGKEPVA